MSKIKIMSGIGIAVFLLSFTGGYFFLQGDGAQPTSSQSDKSQTANTSQPIPLNRTSPAQVASGLQVGSNTGSSSATQASGSQLGVTQSGGTQAQGQGQAQNQNQPNPFDPKTFAQYEKYKNDTTASFADALVGEGAVLESGKTAAVFYRGSLTNGTVFDESRPGADGKLTPFIFKLGEGKVIPGWEQALAGMKAGGVRLVIVPPAAGYGAQQQNGIPANSVLVFQVQLDQVQ